MKALVKVALLVSALTLPAMAIPVTNPGFETGDFTGWTTFGNTSLLSVTNNFPNTGVFYARFGQTGTPGGISQDLVTVPGAVYSISYFLRGDGTATTRTFDVQFGSTVLQSLVNPTAFSYTQFTFLATASSALTTLSFAGRNDPSFFRLDDISVDLVSAPEIDPTSGTIPFAWIGLGLALAQKRRKG